MGNHCIEGDPEPLLEQSSMAFLLRIRESSTFSSFFRSAVTPPREKQLCPPLVAHAEKGVIRQEGKNEKIHDSAVTLNGAGEFLEETGFERKLEMVAALCRNYLKHCVKLCGEG